MTVINTIRNTGSENVWEITKYPSSTKKEVRNFLNKRGMRETIFTPQERDQFKFC